MTETSDSPNYEQNIARLQSVVERLERDSLGLEESLALFEEGMRLAQQCDLQLTRVEERVKVLVSGTEVPATRADIPLEPIHD